jgi:hypothetical protein
MKQMHLGDGLRFCVVTVVSNIFGLTETLTLVVSLFRETSETSLFVTDSVKTSFSSNFFYKPSL